MSDPHPTPDDGHREVPGLPTVGRRCLLFAGVGSAAALALAGCAGRASTAASTPTPSPATAAPTSTPVGAASPSGAALSTIPDATADLLVMVVRHAEKPAASGAPFGVLPDGTQDAESLTIDGWTRAGALVELFDPSTTAGPSAVRDGLRRPDQLVAADPSHGSKRPAQTLTPLAARLGQQLETTWKKEQTADVARSLSTRSGTVLVAWEHELIPELVGHLGTITPTPPPTWPGERFDLVWCLRRTADGTWSFTQVPQLLLAGDSPTVA